MKHVIVVLAVILFVSCSKNKQWQIEKTIELGEVTPIGFTYMDNQFWIADGDHNQVVAVTKTGEVTMTIQDFERPMHLDEANGKLYIPEYGSDQIKIHTENNQDILEIADSLDAPAAVDVLKDEIAIADFYNHRIVYFNGDDWITFGKEGKKEGMFYYPTDIQILESKIVVADAYNNRVQIFDKQGNYISTIGEQENLNAATGLYADEKDIWITDFENNRVLLFNHEGVLLQIIEEQLDKPTDILKIKDVIYIANYGGKNILKLQRK